ncbi:hypothetical protein F52700_13619 [Fusarium sp. NRRL 52700]|nr:hypothetical protein F52700_13619 [Fusarium sp. NRRL 52700]
MDYDSYIQQLTADLIPLERAEQLIAQAICTYMNELADNARNIYKQRVKQRCQDQDQAYVSIDQTGERFPLELFTKNIKANKLDARKWNATIQDYLVTRTPSGFPKPSPNHEQEILNCLSLVDQEVDDAFSLVDLNDNKIADNQLGAVVVIPLIYYIGMMAAAAVLTGVGLMIGPKLRHDEQLGDIPRFPSSGDTWEWPGGGPVVINPVLGSGNPGQNPSPPPPYGIPDPLVEQLRKKRRRDKKKARRGDKDKRRKDHKDYYFGYVDRVEPAGTGYEIRVEAIADNSLSDEVFIRELEKLALAAGNPGFGRYRLALISIYVHKIPPAVEVGKWINFKVDTKNKAPAMADSPDVSGPFRDGVSRLEALEPRFSFFNLRIECYFADNEGFVVQTDVASITKDITASTMATLQAAFNSFNFMAQAITDLFDLFMNSDPIDKEQDKETSNEATQSAQPDSIRDLFADNFLNLNLKKAIPPSRKPKVVKQKFADMEEIEKALFRLKTRATKYNVYDVGQGHSGRVFSGNTEMFANDFGYGRVGGRKDTVCSHMIKGQAKVPILLSHWDADHFRIAKSSVAKGYSGSVDDVTYRHWVAPGGSHMQGTITHELAWTIEQHKKLFQWPDTKRLDVGNVTIVSCKRNTRYEMPDKNNYGALALILGEGDKHLVYPGDANYESVPIISSLNRKVSSLIATHHGSTVALREKGGSVGASIPKAAPKDSYAIFSYAKGNTYGHDIKTASQYYLKAGYQLCDATATFMSGEDTFEITNFGQSLLADNSLWAMPEHLPTVAARREVLPGIYATKMPQPASDVANTTQTQPLMPLSGEIVPQFPALLTVRGSGKGTAKPDQDDLLPYAIRDENGDIVVYDIKASKIILENLPLLIPCTTDYPVVVQLSCHDIEFRGVEPSAGVVPLVRFNVANGFEWARGADAGQDGLSGNPGFAGGRVRLAVAGEWKTSSSDMSGFSIQYCGGWGSNGQAGGRGLPGKNGTNNFIMLVDSSGKETYPKGEPQAGGAGDRGGRGGDAGEPGTVASSEVLAVNDQWPAGWKVVIDTGTPGTGSEFGKAGNAGKGGLGGSGGAGDKYYLSDWRFRLTKKKPYGSSGQNGDDGKTFDGSTAQFRSAKVYLRMFTTEDEILNQMAPVDWRFYFDK